MRPLYLLYYTGWVMHDSSHPIHTQGSILCAVFQKIGHPCFLKKCFNKDHAQTLPSLIDSNIQCEEY